MATPASSARDYCAFLTKSKLLPADEVDAVYRRWQGETGGTDDQAEAFAKYLVGKRVLTGWQAAMILRGRADGFFLEGYKILDQIGKGQMGGVYKAVHSLGQTVALKILPASRAKDLRVLGRFQREARLLTQIDHPNVVRAFQVGESAGRHFIAMEHLEGETLDDVLTRRKQLPVGEAVRLIRQALDGLQNLHERRMIHRDLKPANLMVTPAPARGAADNTLEGTVKVLDIGLGRELFADADSDGQTAAQLTAEGAVVGTPDYMAPEQAKDARTSDIRADIYSLGCVLYHCLVGTPPFPDGNIMTQMLKHATEEPPPLSNKLESVPPGLQEVLDRFLAKSPADRYQTPEAAAQALKRFQTGSGGAAPAKASMTPAYRQWLETESMMELKVELPPAPDKPAREAAPRTPTAAVKPGTGTAAPLPPAPKPVAGGAPSPKSGGTGTAPAVPFGGGRAAAGASPTPSARPHGPTGPQHVVGSGVVTPVPATPTAAPQPWQPAARFPAPAPLPIEEEVEVELVTNLPAAAAPVPAPVVAPAPVYVPVPEDRALWDLNRRDLVMLIAGGGGVLGALGVGYGLARLVRSLKSTPDEVDEKKD